MPRSIADATRFTATAPYATSKSSTVPVGNAPTNETPQQKVQRLREAARRAKVAQASRFDKVWAVGRVWADRAHRATTYTIISASVICFIYASINIGDMLMYNRRRRTEWYKEQDELRARRIAEATQALAMGQANEDQMLLINQERAAVEAQRAREEAKKEGFNTKVWKFVTQASGASKMEETTNGSTSLPTMEAEQRRIAEDERAGLGIVQAVEDRRREGEKPIEHLNLRGGPLDQQAQDNANFVSNSAKSWTNWITRR